MTSPLDHGDFGSNRSKIVNVIDSNSLERDASGKVGAAFLPPALAGAPYRPEAAPGWRFAAAPASDPARWLVGRSVDEAARLVPRVFNLCAAAQGAASAAALGLRDPGAHDAMRAETVRDHAIALFHHWPALIGAEPDRAALALLGKSSLGKSSLGEPEGPAPVAVRICGEAGDLSAFTILELDAWLEAGSTGAARFLRQIRAADPAWGRAELPSVGLADIDAALVQPGALAARETTALDRVRRAPVMTALLAVEGASLFARLLARVLDLLWAAAGRADAPLSGVSPGGAGVAEAARGRLAHKARVLDGRVGAYQVLTPSVWNLAPGGLLERMLAALPSRRETAMLAQLCVGAVNPCAPVTLAFERGA